LGNELEIKVKQELGIIDFNFSEIKDNLTGMMELYKDAKFTEETSATAKKEAATLKKIKKALSDRRIEVKKEFMKPCDDFETKVKELTALIDEPIELIDKQVQVFEEKKKAEKKLKIQDTYNELIGEVGEYLPFSKIYDSKWENVSVSMKSIKEEIDQVVSSVDMAVNTIKGMNSEVVPKALEMYKQNLSLADAISYINKHEQMKAEILAKEERKRKEEEERKRITEENRIKEQERQRVIEDERKRVAEENRIRDEERKKIAEEERIREDERRKAEEKLRVVEVVIATPIKEVAPALDTVEEESFDEPFSSEDISDEPFTVEATEAESELPFVTENEIRATFTVIGTDDEMEQVEMYLDSIGLLYERKDN